MNTLHSHTPCIRDILVNSSHNHTFSFIVWGLSCHMPEFCVDAQGVHVSPLLQILGQCSAHILDTLTSLSNTSSLQVLSLGSLCTITSVGLILIPQHIWTLGPIYEHLALKPNLELTMPIYRHIIAEFKLLPNRILPHKTLRHNLHTLAITIRTHGDY